jgi:hypothetical protein
MFYAYLVSLTLFFPLDLNFVICGFTVHGGFQECNPHKMARVCCMSKLGIQGLGTERLTHGWYG